MMIFIKTWNQCGSTEEKHEIFGTTGFWTDMRLIPYQLLFLNEV